MLTPSDDLVPEAVVEIVLHLLDELVVVERTEVEIVIPGHARPLITNPLHTT